MHFDPHNHIVRYCLKGMASEDSGKLSEAREIFLQAWNEAGNEFERFLAAYYVARSRENVAEKLQWYQTALQLALKINDVAVNSTLHTLHSNIARCHEEINDAQHAQENDALANLYNQPPSDEGPFYHGTKADLEVGDFLNPGNRSNYQEEIIMNHIYFTALANGAGLAAALAKGDGRERVYVVEPMGSFENDPNVTDKKFPGNLTRSYRTTASLKVIGEITGWQKPGNIQEWKDKLANNKGNIIN